MIRTTKYFDSSASQTSLPPAVHRKPVRIVKAVQRSVVSPSVNEMKTSSSSPSPPSKMTPANDSPMSPPNNNDHHLSSEYVRNLFPTPDHQKRNRSRQNSSTNVNNESVPQTVNVKIFSNALYIYFVSSGRSIEFDKTFGDLQRKSAPCQRWNWNQH